MAETKTQNDALCTTCKELDGPNHQHVCAACGADPGLSVLIVGDDSTEHPALYCDRFCMLEDDPSNPILSDITEEQRTASQGKKKVLQAMKALKQRAAEEGVPWI